MSVSRLCFTSWLDLLQLMSPPASGVMGDAWSQQPLCRLQSTPIALLAAPAPAATSSDGACLLYTALQDKSVHKYQLNLPALTGSKSKVLVVVKIGADIITDKKWDTACSRRLLSNILHFVLMLCSATFDQ